MAEDLFSVERDNVRKAASRMESAEFDRKMESHFQGHPELKPGRDFRMEVFSCRDEDEDFRKSFDETFSEAPGSPEWYDKNFCAKCGMRKSLCICIRSNE